MDSHQPEEFTLYQLLNVEKTASSEQIKKSYKQLALQFHPDKNKDDENAREKFQKIAEAYAILSNQEKRSLYDETGAVDGIEQFKNAYDYFRNLYPKISMDDINNFEQKYRYSAEEEQDLLDFYRKHKGDLKTLLETIILSKNEDIPRFLKFYDQQIEEEKIPKFRAFSISRTKIRKLNTESMNETDSLVHLIHSKNNQTDFISNLEKKYGNKGTKKQIKVEVKMKKQQKK